VQAEVVSPATTSIAPVTPAPKPPRRPRANAASTTRSVPSAPAVTRRRRQKPAEPDTATITVKLIEAVLKGRSTTGATALDLEQVVAWASGIRTESQAI
jgi:hypothetical protein